MSISHSTCGAAVGLVTLPHTELHEPWQKIAYVVLWTAAATLPDWDHHSSTPTTTWGPLTQSLTAPVRALPGGHRWATHDLVLGPLAGWAITWLLVTSTDALITLALSLVTALGGPEWVLASLPFLIGVVPLAMLIGLGLKLTILRSGGSGLLNLAISLAAAWWFTQNPPQHLPGLLPWVVAGGMVVHILGDALTEEGIPVPIVWIFTRARIRLPLFQVGGAAETFLITPALSLLVCWLAWGQLPLETQQALRLVISHVTHPN